MSRAHDDSMPPRPRPALGPNLKRLREAHVPKLSQAKLAQMAGLDRSVIARLESGMRSGATLDTIEALARALGVTAAELVGPGEPDAAERGVAEIQPLIDRFEAQERGPAPRVRATPEEIAWLRSRPWVFWRDMPPTLDTLEYLVQAYRSRDASRRK